MMQEYGVKTLPSFIIIFTIMKLHLPTKLRAAVIAAMAFFAVVPAAQATEYDVSAATYSKVIQGKSVTATAGGSSGVEFTAPVSQMRGQEWTMIVSATGFNKYSSVFLKYGSGHFAGGADVYPDFLEAQLDYGFGLMLSDGYLVIATQFSEKYSGAISAYPYKLASKVSKAESVDLILSYTPTLWDDVNLSYTGGTLSVMDGFVTLSDGEKVQISSTPVFEDKPMPGNSKMEIWSTSELPSNASTTVTVILPGTETNWTLTGLTSLQKLVEGYFYEDTTTTGLAAHTWLKPEDKIYFIGKDAVLFTDEDKSVLNEIDTSISMDDPTTPAVIGLGAAAGKTLTMKNGDAILAKAEEAGGLKVTGAGTVAFNCVEDNTISKLTIDPGATLKLNNADHEQTLMLSPGKTSATSNITVSDGTVLLYLADTSAVQLGKLKGEADSTLLEVDGVGNLALKSVETAGNFNLYRDVTVQAGSVQAADITTDTATLKADSVTAKSLSTGSDAVIITGKEGNTFTAQKLTAGTDGVAVAGVQNAVVTLNEGSISSTGATSGTTFKKGSSLIETTSTAGTLGMTADGLTVAGNVAAGTVTLEDYDLTSGATLTATTLNASGDSAVAAKTKLGADTLELSDDATATAGTLEVGTLNIGGNAEAVAKTLTATSANLGGTSLTGAELQNAVLTADGAGFTSMVAESATVAGGYTLAGTSSAPAALNVTNLTVQDGSKLSHVAVNSATTITSSGAQTLEDVVFSAGYEGYTSNGADPIFTVGDTAGLTDVHLTGTISSADGVMLDKIVVNGETIDFSVPTSVTLLETVSGVNAPTDYELNITPFVEALLLKEGNKLVLQGYNNREEMVEQLSDTQDRTAAIQSMLEAYDKGEMKDELNEVFKYLGRKYMFGTTEEDLERSLQARGIALEAASGSSLANLTDAQRRGIEDVQKNLRNRIVQMGGQEEGILHGWDKGNVQAWAQGDGAFHTLSSGTEAAGYDFDIYGATVGANVDLNEHWTVGGALSAEFGSMTSKSSDNMEADTSSIYLNLFARHQKGHWTQMGIFTIGQDSIDTTRKVLDYTADGSTSGTSFSGYYELGYLIPLDEETRQLIQPIFNVSITSAKVDGFSESGSIGNAGLKYDGESLFYGSVGVGARYQAVLAQSVYERNTVLELRGQVNQHFGDSTDEATVSFLGGGSPYTVHGAECGDFGVQLGAGLTIPVYNQTTLFGDVDGEFRSKQTDFRANIGVRYEF